MKNFALQTTHDKYCQQEFTTKKSLQKKTMVKICAPRITVNNVCLRL